MTWIMLLEKGELLPKAQGSEPHVLWVEKEQLQEDGTGTGILVMSSPTAGELMMLQRLVHVEPEELFSGRLCLQRDSSWSHSQPY